MGLDGLLAEPLLHAGFLLGLFFEHEDGDLHVPPNLRLTFNGLHGVISLKMGFF
jgi:hypothetical protein